MENLKGNLNYLTLEIPKNINMVDIFNEASQLTRVKVLTQGENVKNNYIGKDVLVRKIGLWLVSIDDRKIGVAEEENICAVYE